MRVALPSACHAHPGGTVGFRSSSPSSSYLSALGRRLSHEAAGYFVGGLFVSEGWFGWATQEELQPNIDGLSFDEVLLLGLVPGIVTVLVTRCLTRRTRRHRSDTASDRSGASRTRTT